MHRMLPLVFVLALSSLVAACGGSGGGSGPDGAVTDDPCSAGESRCVGSSFQTCGDQETFVERDSCSQACDETLGCVECRPDDARACSGSEVHECNDDGTIGELIEDCGVEGCSSGTCGEESSCDAGGVELIYVVDDEYNLLSFDPSVLGTGEDPFTLIGSLSCPAGSSWPAWPGGDPATPFSMSVDRSGTAWVLYTSGEIFHVSTQDASCSPSGFTPGQAGFELFGMGFVSDAAGSEEETLFISGGSADSLVTGNLGAVDKDSMEVTSVGPLPLTEYSPELTGTGDAELYGYFPGSFDTFVANLDKSTVAEKQSWDLPALANDVRAWAFAHWGGKFYIFITTGFDVPAPQVLELDPSNGNVTPVVPDSEWIVVGAGVSTCAPISVD